MFSTRTGDLRQPLQPGHGRAGAGAEEDDLLEKLHHHGGDLEHKGRVDLSCDMTRHDEERLFQLISNTCATRLDHGSS
jgi:hypothetical protein